MVFPTMIEENKKEDGGVMVHDPKLVELLANVSVSTLMVLVSESTDVTTAVASTPEVALAFARTSLDFVLLITDVRIMPRKIKVTVTNNISVKNIKAYFEHSVTKFGTGAKIDAPKEHIGRNVLVFIKKKD